MTAVIPAEAIAARKIRVMWLLNHGSARQFEVAMLKRIGIGEIFLPKRYPNDPNFRSASVDFSQDALLTIPRKDLELLNAADWYGDAGKEAWTVADRHFDVVFFILFNPEIVNRIGKHFKGAALWRTYGLAGSMTYSKILSTFPEYQHCPAVLSSLGHRFWFAEAYPHLHEIEQELIKSHSVYLPLGLQESSESAVDRWTGKQKTLLFVCPDIGFNYAYQQIYKDFKRNFRGFPYAIAGAQSVRVNDPHVLGYLPRDEHERNMRNMRLLFYHSRDPNHIHFHPFEAVRCGMPLVFMAGGMLDRFGGLDLPGRCRDIKEARKKVARILNDDWPLIEAIRESQVRLLEPMKPDNCETAWRSGFARIVDSLEKARIGRPRKPHRIPRIGVIAPADERDALLTNAKAVTQAIVAGSRQAGCDVEVVLGYPENSTCDYGEMFADVPSSVMRRTFGWRLLGADEANRAMEYAGLGRPLHLPTYMVPDDGMKQFMDCDLWLFTSDRLSNPLLPVRPYVMMVNDYLQRYERSTVDSQAVIRAARGAERVLVTTEFARRDAIQFAGIPASRVIKLPMLANDVCWQPAARFTSDQGYFLWIVGLAPNDNHETAFKALRLYYEMMEGQLECRAVGPGTRRLRDVNCADGMRLRDLCRSSPLLRRQFRLLGEPSNSVYLMYLARSDFLWHPSRNGNGSLSVVDAARLGVPTLSSDYPAMREIDAQFRLNLSWMDAHDQENMARELKRMETDATSLRGALPSREHWASQSVDQLAGAYWNAVVDCL